MVVEVREIPDDLSEQSTSETTRQDIGGECISCDCGDEMGEHEFCPKSRRACGHHCNHSWTHDHCCWCGQEWGEEA